MSDIITTTGRKMTTALQDAIDGLPDRELAIRAFTHREQQGDAMGRLYAALALELRLAALRDQDTFTRLEQERFDDIPEPPLPQATGQPMTFDPETETWSEGP